VSVTQRTWIVVPCYNEAKRLDRAAFLRFARGNAEVRFLFVDDGSTDATGAVLAKLCAERPEQFELLTLPQNGGKAEAVRQGMVRAFGSSARYAGYWDADLATPLEVIRRFSQVLDDSPWLELVMGSRVQLLGRKIERRPARHYLGRVFATFASLVLGLRVYDTQCGAKLFRGTQAMKQLFEKPFGARWIFDVEILARMLDQRHGQGMPADQVIYEEPLTDWVDVGGSKVRATHMIVSMLDLFRIRLERTASARRTAADAARGAQVAPDEPRAPAERVRVG
jgi:glycosyltransferase involved in cell wall biosynthesis